MPNYKLTIAIPVLNEEVTLPICLQAIGKDFANRVVVIDSGSTDRTKEIAHEFGADIIDFNWDGAFPKKRNWFLRNYAPDTEWVLFLDADEMITPAFKAAVRKELSNSQYEGYWLRYSVYFMNKKLKGGYPLHKLALFRVGHGEYEKIDERHWSDLDMEIHEHPVLDGPAGVIKPKIDHQDIRGIDAYLKKHHEYAQWEANRYMELSKSDMDKPEWTWKQRLKYRLIGSPYLSIIYFLGSFILMGGFRDGSRGLTFSLLKASYFCEVYWRIQQQAVNSSKATDESEPLVRAGFVLSNTENVLLDK